MKPVIFLAMIFAMVLSGCAFRAGAGADFRLTQTALAGTGMVDATATPQPLATLPPTDTPAPSPLPTLTATPIPGLFPLISFIQNTNCRKGPAVGYYSVVSYGKGASAELAGRNADGTWLWVRMANDRDYCWASASTITGLVDVHALSVIPFQGLPTAPTFITITRKVCGSPNIMWIEWADVAGAGGYRLYRNGALIQTFPRSMTKTIDFVKNAKAYQYSLEAFNEFGTAPRIAVSETGC